MSDIYGRYKNVRDNSWRVLIDLNIRSLPVNLTEICGAMDITLLDNHTVRTLRPGESGVAVFQHDKWYIVVDETDTHGRQRFTVAHELGHILLGHEMKNGYHTRRENMVRTSAESEADMFAARLLAPACVLWGLNARTAEQIADICDISRSAAEYRASRMEELRKRNKFLTSR
ncbi:MAG: ImmA/IrrE family metallo-endopeptidase, partial [Oscillospiraceae bacterium]